MAASPLAGQERARSSGAVAPWLTEKSGRAYVVAGLSAILVRLPYGIQGPGFMLDDYFTLWWRRTVGLWGTAGPGQLAARPGAWLSYVIEFGVVGRHPLIAYLVLSGFGVAATLMLYRCLLNFVPVGSSLLGTLIWTVTANHSALDHWLSTINIVAGLLLFLVAIDRLAAATRHGTAPATAVVLLAVAGLFYEATLPLACAALVTVPWLLGSRPNGRTVATGEGVLALTGAWMVKHSQHDLHGGWFDYGHLPRTLFGDPYAHTWWASETLTVIALLVAVLSVIRMWSPSFRAADRSGPLIALTGVAIIVLGTLAFARDPITPLALGDRTAQTASIGSALVLVGGLMQLPRKAAFSIAALVVAFGALGHLRSDLDYRAAVRDNHRIIAAILAASPRPPGHPLIVGPMNLTHHGITGMIGIEDQALIAVTGQRGWRVLVATKPADYLAAPPEDRIDITH